MRSDNNTNEVAYVCVGRVRIVYCIHDKVTSRPTVSYGLCLAHGTRHTHHIQPRSDRNSKGKGTVDTGDVPHAITRCSTAADWFCRRTVDRRPRYLPFGTSTVRLAAGTMTTTRTIMVSREGVEIATAERTDDRLC